VSHSFYRLGKAREKCVSAVSLPPSFRRRLAERLKVISEIFSVSARAEKEARGVADNSSRRKNSKFSLYYSSGSSRRAYKVSASVLRAVREFVLTPFW
jgi:hypothetical protein